MSYDINSIESLSFREGVRKRIPMYLGSDDIEGTYQAFKEILNNSTDEALAGYGKKITITVDENNNEISVEDNGRGVPFGIRENGENVLVSIYTKSHTGGKFNKTSYKTASGLNGIGGSCVCLSANFFEVISRRDGKEAKATFHKGILANYQENPLSSKMTGTYVRFSPDSEVFSNGEIGFSYERICQEVKDISYLCPGIEFVLVGVLDGEEAARKVYCAKQGVVDFVRDNNEKPLHKTIMTASASEGEDSLEIAFQWGTGKEKGYVFVNGLRCPEGGSPITGAKSAITKTYNSLSGDKIDGDKIREGLFYIINCKVANPSFANQTKSKINNPSLRSLASTAFTNALKEMNQKYPDDFKKVVEVMRKMAKADEAAERAREAILNHEKESAAVKKKKIIDSRKLRDAKKLGQDSVLLCVEGLSAGGSMSQGRDPNKYGILMLRGKCINCLSNPIEDILANEEVKLLLQALGLTYGQPYNPKKLRYGKIAISSDADFDGSHIGLLIMAMLQKLAPEFLAEGRLCWLRAPIYKVESGKNNYYFYTEEEFQNRTINGDITKFKGLGQMAEQDLKQSLFSEEFQHMDVLESSAEGIDALEKLMGPQVRYRKEFVFNNIDFSEFNL